MKNSTFLERACSRTCTSLVALSAILSLTSVHALDVTVAPGGDIQSALDQVNAAGGGNVNLGAGTHTISSSLLIRGGVTLKGAGSASTTIQNTGSTADYSFIVGPGTGNGITLRDLSMDGRNSAGGNGLVLEGGGATSYTNLSLINLEVRNIAFMGLHPKGVTGITQTNNYVHNSGQFSLAHNQYFRRTNSVNTSGCRFDDSPAGDGAKFTLWDGCTVSNCTFTGNFNRGLRTQDANANGLFTYNAVIGNMLDGMEIVGENTTVSYNGAYNNGLNTTASNRNGISVLAGGGTVANNNSYGNPYNYNIHGAFTFAGNNNTSVPLALPLTQAESYSAMSGITVENCSDTGGGSDVGYINNNDYLVFNGKNLTGYTALEARVGSATAGGTIEVHLDSLTGPLVGTVAVTNTGGWQTWTTNTGAINGASGIHDVYLVFKGGSGYLFNVNWIRFK